MSLPMPAVERLFQRLALTYGSQFARMWDGTSSAEVKTIWAHELALFANNLPAIGWALENLPERCPNLIQFKNLCKQAPRPETAKLDYAKADAQVVDKEIAKIAAEAIQAPKNDRGNVDHRAWAKKLAQRHLDGEVLTNVQVKLYKAALEEKNDL